VQQSLFEEYEAPAIPERLGAVAVGVRPNSKVLAVPRGMASGFDYTLNPYVGCGFACAYCFAANFVADERRKADWGKWVDVKVDAQEQIARAELRGKKIFMSSATDPYQPLELRIGHTRRIVELLVDKQPQLVVQTRSPIVARDIDLLKQMGQASVNMSITTDSDEVRRRFEPSCASIERRLAALEDVANAGIPTTACIAPMLPVKNPRAFARRLREIGVSSVVSGFFHSNERQFAASTRPRAFDIAKEYGWTREDYDRTLSEMHEEFPLVRAWVDPDVPSISGVPVRSGRGL